MKIQEMRSGLSHLSKKTDDKAPKNVFEIRKPSETLFDLDLPILGPCDLDAACWSVLSFDQREAGGLTHDQAMIFVAELDALNVPGLCIVTDTAASRLNIVPI